jgi:hypothetical protein
MTCVVRFVGPIDRCRARYGHGHRLRAAHVAGNRYVEATAASRPLTVGAAVLQGVRVCARSSTLIPDTSLADDNVKAAAVVQQCTWDAREAV